MNKWLVLLAVVVGALAGGAGWLLGSRTGRSVPPDVKGFHTGALARHVPAHAVAAVSFDAGWLIHAIVNENLGLFPARNAGEAHDALVEASLEHLGIDVMRARRAIVWFSARPESVGAFVEGDFGGPLQAGRKMGVGGRDVVRLDSGVHAALVEGGILLGDRRGVEAGLGLEAGDEEHLSGGALRRHHLALSGVRDGPLVLSVCLPEAGEEVARDLAGVRSMAVALQPDGGISAAVHGQERALRRLRRMVDGAGRLAQGLVESEQERASERGRGLQMLGLIVARQKLDDALSAIELEVEDELLTARVAGTGSAGLAALGSLGALFYARKETASRKEAVPHDAPQEPVEPIERLPAEAAEQPAELNFQF